LIQKVLPAIQAVWPQELAGETIWIQQDNAPTHVPSDDPRFLNAVAQTGLDIRLMHQPANSPDMNILDLGLFSSLQSMTDRLVSNNLDELIHNVKQQYDAYDADKINRVFLTLQSCLIEVMKVGGGNGYKIPHMYSLRPYKSGRLGSCLFPEISGRLRFLVEILHSTPQSTPRCHRSGESPIPFFSPNVPLL
jgi:hypothetical protein